MHRADLLRTLGLQHSGNPITYVEIGVYEGMSSCWMCENVLTHPDSRGYGIDPWPPTSKLNKDGIGDVRDLAYRNLSQWNDKFTLIEKPSLSALRDGTFELESIDIFYIDGLHSAAGCILDALNGWPLVKIGGTIVFDDYMTNRKEDHVYSAVHAIMDALDTCSRDWVMIDRQAACVKTGPAKEELFPMTISDLRKEK